MTPTTDRDYSRRYYDEGAVVQDYASRSALQPPEQTILDLIRREIAGVRMLDIGVGGGRTTVHFAPAVASYVGTDFAPSMVEACRERFTVGDPEKVAFEVCDVRDTKRFGPGSFGLVLFSFNGLDTIFDEAERRDALGQIRDVLVPGGLFAVSTLNLNYAENALSWRFGLRNALWRRSRTASQRARDALRPFKWNLVNRGAGATKSKGAALLASGSARFEGSYLRMSYNRPEAQVRQLEEAGFQDCRVFDLDGRELALGPEAWDAPDHWLYYLCRRR